MTPAGPPTLEALRQELARLDAAQRAELGAWLAARAPATPGDAPHLAVGRLFFEDWKAGTPRKPLHHFEVEVWERGFAGVSRRLAAGTTDLAGAFAIPFPAPADLRHPLSLRLFEVVRTYGEDGTRHEQRHQVHTVEGGPLPVAGPLDFGDVDVPFWPYSYAGPLPRVLIPPGAEPPQDYARGRKTALVKAIAELGLIRGGHLLEHRLAPHLPTLEAIQRAYPESLTQRLERERPGSTRSDAYFVDRVLNGLNPCLPVGDARHPGELRVGFNWDACEMDGEHVLPNVDAWFVREGDQLVPRRITFQRRLPGSLAPGSPLEPPQTYTPADGEAWLRAKRLFRVAWSLHGQIVAHLAEAHLNVEQYALAAFRNLRISPLRDLLFPHLKEVAVINHGGTDLIFGERGFVTLASALTARAVDGLFVASLGRLDWKGWRPRRPLVPGHVFAHAAQLYWEVLERHVADFFAAHEAELVATWPEVRRFSDDLVAHAVAHVPPALAPWDVPLDTGELGDQAAPRVAVDGVAKAVRPVTLTDAPAPGELAELQQLCRYVIYHATFFHAWPNDRQHDDGGELRDAALGLRGTGWGPEDDDAIAQSPPNASEQIFLALFLQNTRYGYVLRNEDGDVPHRLVELLGERADAFAAIGYDPHQIRSRINI